VGAEALRAEAHHERDDGDALRGRGLGRQVAGGVGDDRDAGHGRLLRRAAPGGGLKVAAMIRTRVEDRGSRRPTRYASDMARPVLAVIFGTFTLRLATGITGAMLIYYYADFPAYGGQPVDAR